jgi:hypothetical protein
MGSTPVGISASRGAAILGLSEFQSQFEVWQLIMEERFPPRPNKKGAVNPKIKAPTQSGYPGFNASRGYLLPEFKEGAPLRWGKAFEDAVIVLAEEARGQKIVDREKFYFYNTSDGDPNIQHPQSKLEAAFVTCHIDGAYEVDPDIHEGKTTSAFPYREKWGEPGTDKIPTTYQVQAQHQLICKPRAKRVVVSVLVFPESQDHWERLGWTVGELPHGYVLDGPGVIGLRPIEWARVLAQMGYFHQYPVEANPDAQKLLIDGYRHFWDHHILEAVEPEIKEYDDIRRAFPEPVGTVVVDDEMASWFAERDAIKEEIGGKGPLSKRADELKVTILARARTIGAVKDEESEKKIIFRDQAGKKLGQFDGKTFR